MSVMGICAGVIVCDKGANMCVEVSVIVYVVSCAAVHVELICAGACASVRVCSRARACV